jgi:diguanylate cyclase (GGDEF)-like protein
MSKRVLIGLGFFGILLLPVAALSLWAYTVLHQVIVLASVLLVAWVGYYISDALMDRDRLSRELFMHIYELKKSREALDSCLASDAKTKSYNIRLLETRLNEECDRARRYGRALSFVLFAIDPIQDFTLKKGKHAPEIVVHEVSTFLRESMRTVDIMIRYGDDQFVTLLPETNLNQAGIVAERIRYAVEKNNFQVEGRALKVTISVSFICFDASLYQNRDDVIKALERALHIARRAGPNHVATLAQEIS